MRLIENTKLAEHDCVWCDAMKGRDVHSPCCPLGERYKQVQKLGGVPWPKGKPLLDRTDFISERDWRVYQFRNSPAPSGDGEHCLECGITVEPYGLICDECHSFFKAASSTDQRDGATEGNRPCN